MEAYTATATESTPAAEYEPEYIPTPEDWRDYEEFSRRYDDRLLAARLDADPGDVECPPESWPSWTDEVWELGPDAHVGPTEEDDRWHAAEVARAESRRDFDAMLARHRETVRECREWMDAFDRRCRGYESAELAEMGSALGHDA